VVLPYEPGGTTSQAWSVAEVLRILEKYNIMEEKNNLNTPDKTLKKIGFPSKKPLKVSFSSPNKSNV